MKYATKHVEVTVEHILHEETPEVPRHEEFLITFEDGSQLVVNKIAFEKMFRPAQSEGEQEFQSSLGAGRISGKKAKAAK